MALTIEDRLALEDLYSRWCITIDDGDTEGWADTYTDDGVFALVEPPLRVQGRADLVAMAAEVYAHDEGLNRHVCLNVLFEGSGDTATGRSDALILELRTGGDARIIKTCRYHDRLVRQDGVWRIAERLVTWDTPHMPVQPEPAGGSALRARLAADD